MDITVTILGNNSAIPAYGRHPTAQTVEINGSIVLLDCGEGAQMQMQRYGIHQSKIDYICISHMHGDHYYGLVSLLSTMCMLNRTTPLTIFAPPEIFPILDMEFFHSFLHTTLPFSLTFKEIRNDAPYSVLVREKYYELAAFPTEHGIPCHGFKITTRTEGRKIKPDIIEKYGIPYPTIRSIKAGSDYIMPDGSHIPNEILTEDGPAPKSYAYTADTRFTDVFLDAIRQVDTLYHESTYTEDNIALASERYHSTARQAALTAVKANVKQLLLGHYSSRYKDISAFASEASAIFPATTATREGNVFRI